MGRMKCVTSVAGCDNEKNYHHNRYISNDNLISDN